MGEDFLAPAIREFGEETGRNMDPDCEFIGLGSIQQQGGKIVHAWAFEGDWEDGRAVESNTLTIERPPGSGQALTFPEADRAEFFLVAEARRKIKDRQAPFLNRLETALKARG